MLLADHGILGILIAALWERYKRSVASQSPDSEDPIQPEARCSSLTKGGHHEDAMGHAEDDRSARMGGICLWPPGLAQAAEPEMKVEVTMKNGGTR